MSRAVAAATLLVVVAGAPLARAQDTTLEFTGEVDLDDGVAYFAVPFEVPAGTAEIEVRHDDLSAQNILDWGLLGPGGAFRGYGGGNTEPAIVNAAAASRSYLPGPITAGTWEVYVGEAKVTELPARYRVEVVLRRTATLPAQPERAPYLPPDALSSEPGWYAGDFHVHSRHSGDASATFDEVLDLARERGLDFVELSEHNTTSQLDYYVDLQSRTPDVLLLPGVEVTTYEGHANAIGLTAWVDHRIGVAGRTMTDVVEEARAQGALFAPNHPELRVGDRCIGCGWDAEVDPALLTGLEIMTGDARGPAGVLAGATFRTWEEMVGLGHHITAIGGSDDHRAGQGTGDFDSPLGTPTTMVWAEELSVEGILEGVRAGRTVVLFEGPRAPMIELDAEGRDGDTVTADAPTLTARVTRAPAEASLRLLRNGEVVGRYDTEGADPFDVALPTFAPASGEDAWRAEVWTGRFRLSVTSHLFVRAASPGFEPPPDGGPRDAAPDAPAPDAGDGSGGEGGCGCRVASSAPSRAPLVALALAVLVAWRRLG